MKTYDSKLSQINEKRNVNFENNFGKNVDVFNNVAFKMYENIS